MEVNDHQYQIFFTIFVYDDNWRQHAIFQPSISIFQDSKKRKNDKNTGCSQKIRLLTNLLSECQQDFLSVSYQYNEDNLRFFLKSKRVMFNFLAVFPKNKEKTSSFSLTPCISDFKNTNYNSYQKNKKTIVIGF